MVFDPIYNHLARELEMDLQQLDCLDIENAITRVNFNRYWKEELKKEL